MCLFSARTIAPPPTSCTGTHNRSSIRHRTAHPVAIGSWRVEAANAPHHRSAIGHELAKRAAFGHPVGLVYRVTGAQVDVSIYSIGDVDVSAVAREFGGGGHRNASGFSVSLQSWLARFV